MLLLPVLTAQKKVCAFRADHPAIVGSAQLNSPSSKLEEFLPRQQVSRARWNKSYKLTVLTILMHFFPSGHCSVIIIVIVHCWGSGVSFFYGGGGLPPFGLYLRAAYFFDDRLNPSANPGDSPKILNSARRRDHTCLAYHCRLLRPPTPTTTTTTRETGRSSWSCQKRQHSHIVQ